MARRTPLNTGTSIRLNAAGDGTASIGPDSARGPAVWIIDGVILTNGRPGQAPIPRVQVYIDTVSAANRQGLSYDGSFAQGKCDIRLTRGQQILAVWAAGQPGDICEFTVTGWKEQ
jgi:hypothetical protein